MFLNKSISERRKACITNLLQVITNAVEMKATKRIVLLLALNKLRKRKILFRRKMKNVLLTFTLFMQKQDYIAVQEDMYRNCSKIRKLIVHAVIG